MTTSPDDDTALPETTEVLIVGGWQAGLGMGYRLREAGVPFVIVDDRARVGDVWRDVGGLGTRVVPV